MRIYIVLIIRIIMYILSCKNFASQEALINRIAKRLGYIPIRYRKEIFIDFISCKSENGYRIVYYFIR